MFENLFKRAEKRASPENPAVPISSPDFLEQMGLGDVMGTTSGETVTKQKALGIPAFYCGVNFVSGAVAGLPLQVFEKTETGRKKVTDGVADVLGGAVNEELTSFQWRKNGFDELQTEGRFLTYIERTRGNKIANLWPLECTAVVPKRVGGRKVYVYSAGGTSVTYKAKDVIDLSVMMKPDGVRHYRPISLHKETFSQAIAAMKYAARFFQNGGVPPFAISGPIQTAAGVDRAGKDLTKAVVDASRLGRTAVALPAGHEMKALGIDPLKMQMVEVRRFLIEEIARIVGLPKVFLMDLTNGTFSNTEQQDLQLVKHYLKRWIEQFEEELNLKLFGRGSRFYVRFALDGLMRGDLLSRMQAYAQMIQNGIRKPNEVRALEELEPDDAGNELMIQGGTFSLKNQLKEKPVNAPAQ